MLPERDVPLRQRVTAPDVVDQHVEPAVLLAADPLHQGGDLGLIGVVDAHGDASPAGLGDQFGSFVDRLRSPHRGGVLAGAAPGGVNGRAGGAELDGNAAPGAPRCARHQRDLAGKWERVHARNINEDSFSYAAGVPRPKTVSDEKVLEAAARVVGRVGPGQLTLADVAAEVGLSPATLVQRFGSKRALLLAVSEHGARAVGKHFEQADQQPAASLDALLEALLELAEPAGRPDELANHLAFLQLDLGDSEFRTHAVAFADALEKGIRRLLDRATAAGELGDVDTAALASSLHVTYHGALLTWALQQREPLPDFLREQLEVTLAPATSVQRPRHVRRTSASGELA